MRVYELAKELGLSSKELLAKAEELGIKIKSSVSSLDENTILKLKASFREFKSPPATVSSKNFVLTQEVQEKDVKTMGSLLDKVKEKEIRVIRPIELEQVTRTSEIKEKRPPRFSSKPVAAPFKKITPQQTIEKAKPISQISTDLIAKKKVTEERKIILTPPVTVKKLSEKLGIKANLIIKKLMDHRIMKGINDILDEDALLIVGLEFNYEIEIKTPSLVDKIFKDEPPDRPEDLILRPPVVVLMGHVDHGKTTLLDRIRGSNVVASEAGGITQHLGSYQVEVNNRKITFLDTPGHKAFTNMRARGANVTDIVLLVVAADDGVMPQTEEAISHARAAKVPIVVAITKIDKKEANPIKVKQQLANLDLIPEEWGGRTIFVEVSGLTGQGIDQLLEMLLLQAEIMELKANPNKKARGTVLEAKVTDGLGVLVTGLVQNGTLHTGDVIVCGSTYGRVRAIFDDKFKLITAAGPSMPIAFTGLTRLPEVGDSFFVVNDLREAKEIVEAICSTKKESSAVSQFSAAAVKDIFQRLEEEKIKEIRFIIKADVKGSLEVITNLLNNLSSSEVKVKIIHRGLGAITESDVFLAEVSDAIIIGFHVQPEERARELAEQRNIEIKLYEIIYQLADEIKLILAGALEPEKVEVSTAYLIVRQIFKISRYGTVAGCYVNAGKVERSNLIRVKRGKEIIFTGKIASLKRFKEDVREVSEGLECGLKIDGFDDIQEGDVIEAFRIEMRPRKLEIKED